ncbi:MAG TPA: glycosyltransferase family 4 protein [Tepidisphaeraceae bacterium]
MPRRILLLITDLEIGGTPTVVRELARRLHAPPDIEIEVASLKDLGPVAEAIRAVGIPVHALGARRITQLRSTVRRLRTLVRERSIDTVFSFLVHANVVAALATAKLPGVRFFQSIQTIQPRPRWHWWAQRWAHARAERIVVPSTAIVRMARQRSGIPESKFTVIPNAIAPDDFPRLEVFRRPVVRAGYLGRLDPAKSPGLLIAALECTAADDFQLHYFGDGSARPALERAGAHSRVANRIHFHGAVPRPQDALNQIDVLWQPSTVEGFGLVLLEAMASGVPVVACAAGGVTDILTDRQNGLLINAPFSADQFADSLRLLRDDPALRQRLIDNARQTVRDRFTWDAILPQYRQLLVSRASCP